MSKYNVLDLFCGCGGLSKGFEMAGFNIIGGVDFNKEAIDTFNNNGAKIIVPIISIHAGTKHIRIAGRPTFFKSEKFKDKPALVKIITNAICLKSPDIVSIESSTKFRQCGLNTIPTIIIPNRLGNFIFENSHPTNNPNSKIIAILVNI